MALTVEDARVTLEEIHDSILRARGKPPPEGWARNGGIDCSMRDIDKDEARQLHEAARGLEGWASSGWIHHPETFEIVLVVRTPEKDKIHFYLKTETN